jgi:hypothetical protein
LLNCFHQQMIVCVKDDNFSFYIQYVCTM